MQNLYDPDSLYASDPAFRAMVDSSGLFGPDSQLSNYASNMRGLMNQYLSTSNTNRNAVMQSNGLYGNYGSAGPVSVYSTNMSGADAGYGGGIIPGQVAAWPGQETAFADLQSKYPGYTQVAGLSAGAGPGGSGIRSYYDPSTAITDPVYGLLAPVTATGQAGKQGVGFMQQGGAVLAAMIGAGLGSQFLSSYLGGAGDVAGAAGSSGSSTPLIGSGSLIPDYTGGIGTNAGLFGTGVTSGTAGATGIPGLSLSNLGTIAKLGGGIASLFGGGGTGGSGSGGSGGYGNMNSLFDLAQGLVGAGIGYASSNRLADQLMHVAERAGQLGDPLQQQPRIPYQGQLTNLLTPAGAQSFMSTDPGVLGMMDQANNAFQGQASKAGSGGTTYTNYLRNISDILGSQYNNRINQLTNLGGFQFAPNPGGYGQIGSMSALYNAGGLGGLGNLLGGGTPTLNTLLNGGSMLGNGIGDLYNSLSSLFGGGGTADTSGFTSTYDPISNYFGSALNTTGSTNMSGFMGNMFGNSSSDFGNLLDTNSLWSLS